MAWTSARKAGVLDRGARLPVREDCLLEGSGFELPVPLRALFCAFADADETNLPGQGFRDRKFADSSLEGNGFELPVPRAIRLRFREFRCGPPRVIHLRQPQISERWLAGSRRLWP